MIRRVYNRDPVYSLLLTFGLAFVMQDAARYIWGPNGLPMGLPDFLSQPISADLFFITWYRVFMVAIVIVSGARAVRVPALHPGRRAHPCRHARPRDRGLARRQCQLAADVQFRPRLPAGRPQRACSPQVRSASIPTWATIC